MTTHEGRGAVNAEVPVRCRGEGPTYLRSEFPKLKSRLPNLWTRSKFPVRGVGRALSTAGDELRRGFTTRIVVDRTIKQPVGMADENPHPSGCGSTSRGCYNRGIILQTNSNLELDTLAAPTKLELLCHDPYTHNHPPMTNRQ